VESLYYFLKLFLLSIKKLWMQEFHPEREKVAKEAHRILKPNKSISWLIGDHWRKKSGFIPVGFKIYTILEKYFEPIDIIIVSRHNQTSNTPLWHERAKNTTSIFEDSNI